MTFLIDEGHVNTTLELENTSNNQGDLNHQSNASNDEAKDFKTWLLYDFPRIQSPLFGSTIVVSTLDDFLEQSVNSLCDFAEEAKANRRAIQDRNNKPNFPDCKPLQDT